MTIAHDLAEVRARVARACSEAGRDSESARLIAVSKTMPALAVTEAWQAGQRHFGESYAQELRDKARDLAGLVDLRWHFIGRVQRNKAKYVARHAFRVHAVEGVAQAEALAAAAPAPLTCLVAVNVGGEETKGGVAPDAALDLCARLDGVVTVRGLMCIPPYREDPEEAAPFFAELADLAARGRAQGLALEELSMGMSHDFPVAIRHGATWIRVGTAIFGVRS
jgi:pyridoxal phosphate enzyme (YggS family)